MNLENSVKKASQILKDHNIYSHELDAQIILSDNMGIKREFLITNSEINISEKIKNKFDVAIKRRIKREPVAYITGKKEFWSQNFIVNYSTLVPRPETELLIYQAINFFKNKKITTKNTHETGCTLSSAITTFFSCGKPLKKSCELGTKYVNQAIGSNLNFGKGHGPINHLNSIIINKKFR